MESFKGRANARCPWCWSLERHRLIALYLRERTTVLTEPTDLLHVAPEEGVQRVLQRARSVHAVGIDRDHPLAERKMDIRDLRFPDGSFDVAICSHVLEHVWEDRAAIGELFRVLRPGGFALILVPWDESAAATREDAAVIEPADREREYGQHDHVRFYGRDLVDRLAEAGFQVEVDRFGASLSDTAVRRYALTRDPIFRCRRPEAAAPAR
jgi:SAM-dependent methyltransferase